MTQIFDFYWSGICWWVTLILGELHHPEPHHQSIENKVLIWARIHHDPLIYSKGPHPHQPREKKKLNWLKSVIPKLSWDALAHCQRQKGVRDQQRWRLDAYFISRFESTSMQLMLLLPLAELTAHLLFSGQCKDDLGGSPQHQQLEKFQQ